MNTEALKDGQLQFDLLRLKGMYCNFIPSIVSTDFISMEKAMERAMDSIDHNDYEDAEKAFGELILLAMANKNYARFHNDVDRGIIDETGKVLD